MAGTTKFPIALDSHTGGDPYGFAELVNLRQTTLVGDHSATATTLTVVSTAGFPTRGVLVVARGGVNEVVHYTGQSGGTQFTGCTRGSQGTLATTHINGEVVASARTASHHNDLAAAIVAIETVLGGGSTAANGIERALSSYTVGVGGIAQIDFVQINQNYRNLRLEMLTFNTTTPGNILLRFSDGASGAPTFDTGNNYDYQTISSAALAATLAEALATNSILVGRTGYGVAGAAAPAVIDIPNYSSAVLQKAVLASWGGKDGLATTNIRVASSAGFWRDTDPIQAIRILPSSNNFGEGSRVTLYGRPA